MKPNINLWMDDMNDYFKSTTLVDDLSERVKKNKWLFKDKYKSISEYFKKSNISNWWNPEEGKGDVGQGLFAEMQKEKRLSIQDWVLKKKFKKVLEIGPGTGRFTFFLNKKFSVVAVEINNNFYKKLKKKNYDNVTLLHNDITEIDLEESEFDCVFLIDVIMHISHIPNLFKKIKTWLKSDGVLIVDFTPLKWYECYNKKGTVHRGIDEKEFEKLLEYYQFDILESKQLKDKNGVVQYYIYVLKNIK